MSKIGEHAYSTTEWTGRAGIVKAFNCGPGPLKAAPDDAWRIYRKFMGEFQPRDGAEVAREVIADLQGYRHPKLSIELYVGAPQDQIAAICDQIAQALPVCRAEGVGLAAFSFYTGQPEVGIWQYAANRGWCGLDPARDVVSVQEYTNNGTVDNPVNVGRFEALITCGWKGGIAVTEAGYDSAGTPNSGWRSALTEDQFYAYLQDYDALLARYPQVIGATVFNAPGWPSFEFHDDRKKFSIITTGDVAMADALEDRVASLEQRDALITQALHRILTGDYTGASGAAADVVALQGGQDDLSGNVKTPTFA